MVLSPQYIDHNGDHVEQRHDDKHLPISQSGDQNAGNAAAHTDADVIGAQKGGVGAPTAFRRSDGHRHGLQCGLQAAEAEAGQHGGKQVGYDVGAKAPLQE